MKLNEKTDVSNINIQLNRGNLGSCFMQIRDSSYTPSEKGVGISYPLDLEGDDNGKSATKFVEDVEINKAVGLLNECELPLVLIEECECKEDDVIISVYYYGIPGYPGYEGDFRCGISYEDALKVFDKLGTYLGSEVFEQFVKLIEM